MRRAGYQGGKNKAIWRGLPKLFCYRKFPEKDSGGESCLFHSFFSALKPFILAWIGFRRLLTSWFGTVIGTLLVQRLISQCSWFNVIGRVTVFAKEFSSSSTRQAITYNFVCFPPQCIFVLLSNKTFHSDTNTLSTSYAWILCISFTNCADGNHFFPPRRHNSGHNSRGENIRRGAGKYEGTVCACDTNETNHGLTTG